MSRDNSFYVSLCHLQSRLLRGKAAFLFRFKLPFITVIIKSCRELFCISVNVCLNTELLH